MAGLKAVLLATEGSQTIETIEGCGANTSSLRSLAFCGQISSQRTLALNMFAAFCGDAFDKA